MRLSVWVHAGCLEAFRKAREDVGKLVIGVLLPVLYPQIYALQKCEEGVCCIAAMRHVHDSRKRNAKLTELADQTLRGAPFYAERLDEGREDLPPGVIPRRDQAGHQMGLGLQDHAIGEIFRPFAFNVVPVVVMSTIRSAAPEAGAPSVAPRLSTMR